MTFVCLLADCTRCSESLAQLFEPWTWLVCMLNWVRLCVTSQLSRATSRRLTTVYGHTKRGNFSPVNLFFLGQTPRKRQKKKKKKQKKKHRVCFSRKYTQHGGFWSRFAWKAIEELWLRGSPATFWSTWSTTIFHFLCSKVTGYHFSLMKESRPETQAKLANVRVKLFLPWSSPLRKHSMIQGTLVSKRNNGDCRRVLLTDELSASSPGFRSRKSSMRPGWTWTATVKSSKIATFNFVSWKKKMQKKNFNSRSTLHMRRSYWSSTSTHHCPSS